MTSHPRRGIAILLAAAALVGCSDDAAGDDAAGDDAGQTATTTAATSPTSTTESEIQTETETESETPTESSTASTEATSDTTASDTTASDTTASVSSTQSTALSEDEVSGVLWMREEEQLAHDLYAAFHDQWGLRIFENINASEQQHIDLTIDLLDEFDLDDPAAGLATGTFAEPQLQAVYDELLAQGTESELDALYAGALVEELDIADLRERAAATDDPTLDETYARLERASRNHLRAFVSQIEARGETYEPQVLDDAAEILSTPMERGPDA